MSFIEPITIKDAVDNIHLKKFLLPAIQREFVWSADKITALFDSLMRDYPIGSFLFWTVESDNLQNYQFYEFIRDYHERDNRHNPKAPTEGETVITAILDGQQRLTALYIGLKGSFAYKLPRKRWDNDVAFPKRKLHLNLLSESPEYDMVYDFQFLTKEEAKANDEDHFWFDVSKILDMPEAYDVNDYLIEQDLSRLEKERARFANRCLANLQKLVHDKKTIHFFLERGKELDKVLNIFIRVNSGGTQLSYSDLLLSIATAQWKEKDAREEITEFVDELNGIGDGFNFDKDFVLKSCLVLSDFTDIAFKVDNFNTKNMLLIEQNWDNISQALRLAVTLISSFGFSRETLTSNNALIPIAYYLLKIGIPVNYPESSIFKTDRERLIKWLISCLLKRAFSGQPDNILRPIRDVLREYHDQFPLENIIEKLKTGTKSIIFYEEDIQNLMYYQYGQSYSFSVLALLYPSLDFRNRFHQDHIFPKKLFTKVKLLKYGIPEDTIDFYLNNYNYIGNLQLLEGTPNLEKSGRDFNEWLLATYPNEIDRKDFMKKHFIPDINLELSNFEEFISKRKELIFAYFKNLLPA